MRFFCGGGEGGFSDKMRSLGCQEQRIENPALTPCAKCAVPQQSVFREYLAICGV